MGLTGLLLKYSGGSGLRPLTGTHGYAVNGKDRRYSQMSAGCGCHRPVARVAAGVTWTCVVASAPWAARLGHTSVIDAAGAIYVIGGEGRSVLEDVWASATGGA
jgi:hypothetical protein